MYQDFFSFAEPPFAIVPNPKFFFLSERHKEALSHMLSGISGGGGMALLTGEVGTGKTMTMRALLARLPTKSQVLTIVNPSLTEFELLQTICDGFELSYKPEDSFKTLLDHITNRLYDNEAQGIDSILLVDEAQHLKPEALELLRLLTNIETVDYKLLKVILIGQPELHQVLSQENLRQLAQRITERYQLMPLPEDELKQYILHRLTCAEKIEQVFNDGCYPIFCRYTGGIPRLINLVCDQALKIAYREGKRYVSADMARQACEHVIGWQKQDTTHPKPKTTKYKAYSMGALGAVGVIFLASSLTLLIRSKFGSEQPINIPHSEIEQVAIDVKEPIETSIEPIPAVEPEVVEEQISLAIVETLSFSNLVAQSISMGVAVQNLYEQWGYEADEKASGCRQETRANLSCYRGVMQLDQLININRPAALVMQSRDGRLWYAIIKAADEEKIEIITGRNKQSVLINKDFVREHWTGEAILLWRPPYGNTSILSMGQRSNRVRWLDERLNMALGEFEQIRNHFDQHVKNKVIAFQVQQNMDADGIAGPLTIMMLDGVLGLAGPILNQNIPTTENEKTLIEDGKIVIKSGIQEIDIALRPIPESVTPTQVISQKQIYTTVKAKPQQSVTQVEEKTKVNTTKPKVINSKDPVELALGNEMLAIDELDLSSLSPKLAKKVENALIDVAKRPEPDKESDQPASQDYSNVVKIADLSPSILQRLPPMNFQAHVYASEPTSRWIKVNNKNIVEGQNIEGRVLLRGVEPHQVVIQFEEQLIAIPALSTW